mgnify:CR=1 FL=1
MISISRPVNWFAQWTAVRHCHADVIVVESAGRHMYIDFKGKATHAGMYPWKDRSALGAVEILHRSSELWEVIRPYGKTSEPDSGNTFLWNMEP